MKFQSKTAKIAIAAAVSGAMLLPATGAFAASKTERALLGGLLGAAAGAAISGGDTQGVVIGAAAGSVLGVATAKDHNYRRSYRTSQPYYRDAGYYRNQDGGRYYRDGYRDDYRRSDYRHGYYR